MTLQEVCGHLKQNSDLKRKMLIFLNGWYSNFPLCCIINFVIIHQYYWAIAIWMNQHQPEKDLVGYVRCCGCRRLDYRIKFIRKGHVESYWQFIVWFIFRIRFNVYDVKG